MRITHLFLGSLKDSRHEQAVGYNRHPAERKLGYVGGLDDTERVGERLQTANVSLGKGALDRLELAQQTRVEACPWTLVKSVALLEVALDKRVRDDGDDLVEIIDRARHVWCATLVTVVLNDQDQQLGKRIGAVEASLAKGLLVEVNRTANACTVEGHREVFSVKDTLLREQSNVRNEGGFG